MGEDGVDATFIGDGVLQHKKAYAFAKAAV